MDRASWSDPPEFLMIEIVKYIDSRFDILRIRAVCTLWRSFVPSHFLDKTPPFLAKLPWPIHGPKLGDLKWNDYYVLKETIICRLEKVDDTVNSRGCSFEWLVMIEERMASIISSPKQTILPYPKPKKFNLMEFRVIEICKAYKLLHVMSCIHATSFDVMKTVVSSHDDFAIFVMQYPQDMSFLKLGDEKWTSANTALDIVCYKGKLYAVDDNGKLVMFDSSKGLTEIVRPMPNAHHHTKYLVESFGDLLLVEKLLSYIDDYGVADVFEVYKLDEQKQCWVKVISLEDVALFVARKCSFSVRAKDYSGNCIYFKSQNEDQTFVYNLTDDKSCPVTSLRCHSDVSWPPPNWC